MGREKILFGFKQFLSFFLPTFFENFLGLYFKCCLFFYSEIFLFLFKLLWVLLSYPLLRTLIFEIFFPDFMFLMFFFQEIFTRGKKKELFIGNS